MAPHKETAAPLPDEEEPVSLDPFTFEEVLAGVLSVNPDDLDDEEPEQP